MVLINVKKIGRFSKSIEKQHVTKIEVNSLSVIIFKLFVIYEILGTLSFGCSFIGYFNAFYDKVKISVNKNANKNYNRGYGLGYEMEVLNQIHFWCVFACYLFSISTIVILIRCPLRSQRWKQLTQLLQLLFGIFLVSSWVCGIVGTTYFSSNCCHVSYGLSINTTYNESPLQGYSSRCNCSLTLKWKQQHINDTDTEHWSPEIYNQSETILQAIPHNLFGRVIFLIVSGLWVAIYAVAVCIQYL